jgi:DNA-binding MarR family transcriptional regulator
MSPKKDMMLTPASTEEQKALINIFYTYYFLVDKMSSAFKKYDITRQQFYVLKILKSVEPGAASVNLIKARMLDKMSDVSRIVERLRIKGLIVRQSAEKDKRSVDVILTAKGSVLLDQLEGEIDHLSKLIINLTAEETINLNTMLDRIRTNAGVLVSSDFAD